MAFAQVDHEPGPHVHVDLDALLLRRNAFNRKDMLGRIERDVLACGVDELADPRGRSQRRMSDGSAPFLRDEHLYVRPVDHAAQVFAGEADLACCGRCVLCFSAQDGFDCGLDALGDAQRLAGSLVSEGGAIHDVWDVIDALED